jgi:alpha-1,2-mannosyltransferase
MIHSVGWLRDAHWMNRERAAAYSSIFVIAYMATALGWLALSDNGVDRLGKAIGTDFTSFWAASRLALEGRAPDVYQPAVHYQAQQASFSGADIGYSAFFYPPVYLLLCLPLALLPYLASLAAWLGLTGFAYWRMVRAYLGEHRWLAVPAFAFPATFINIGHGQNGFLTAALFGGGLLLLSRQPILAGVLFGCLAFKPQLALVLPIALVAAERWRTILAAAITAISLAGLSLIVFGIETWDGFLAVSSLARAALEQNLVGNQKMQSAFAAVRLLGGQVMLAYAVQAVLAVAVCAVLVMLLRRRPGTTAEAPAVAAAALLISPFLLDYDLVLLAVPLAWAAREGARTGFMPWEKLVLIIGFLLPLLSRLFATGLGIPLAPLALMAVFGVVMRRAYLVSSPALKTPTTESPIGKTQFPMNHASREKAR